MLQSKGVERVTLDELVAETLPHARGTSALVVARLVLVLRKCGQDRLKRHFELYAPVVLTNAYMYTYMYTPALDPHTHRPGPRRGQGRGAGRDPAVSALPGGVIG